MEPISREPPLTAFEYKPFHLAKEPLSTHFRIRHLFKPVLIALRKLFGVQPLSPSIKAYNRAFPRLRATLIETCKDARSLTASSNVHTLEKIAGLETELKNLTKRSHEPQKTFERILEALDEIMGEDESDALLRARAQLDRFEDIALDIAAVSKKTAVLVSQLDLPVFLVRNLAPQNDLPPVYKEERLRPAGRVADQILHDADRMEVRGYFGHAHALRMTAIEMMEEIKKDLNQDYSAVVQMAIATRNHVLEEEPLTLFHQWEMLCNAPASDERALVIDVVSHRIAGELKESIHGQLATLHLIREVSPDNQDFRTYEGHLKDLLAQATELPSKKNPEEFKRDLAAIQERLDILQTTLSELRVPPVNAELLLQAPPAQPRPHRHWILDHFFGTPPIDPAVASYESSIDLVAHTLIQILEKYDQKLCELKESAETGLKDAPKESERAAAFRDFTKLIAKERKALASAIKKGGSVHSERELSAFHEKVVQLAKHYQVIHGGLLKIYFEGHLALPNEELQSVDKKWVAEALWDALPAQQVAIKQARETIDFSFRKEGQVLGGQLLAQADHKEATGKQEEAHRLESLAEKIMTPPDHKAIEGMSITSLHNLARRQHKAVAEAKQELSAAGPALPELVTAEQRIRGRLDELTHTMEQVIEARLNPPRDIGSLINVATEALGKHELAVARGHLEAAEAALTPFAAKIPQPREVLAPQLRQRLETLSQIGTSIDRRIRQREADSAFFTSLADAESAKAMQQELQELREAYQEGMALEALFSGFQAQLEKRDAVIPKDSLDQALTRLEALNLKVNGGYALQPAYATTLQSANRQLTELDKLFEATSQAVHRTEKHYLLVGSYAAHAFEIRMAHLQFRHAIRKSRAECGLPFTGRIAPDATPDRLVRQHLHKARDGHVVARNQLRDALKHIDRNDNRILPTLRELRDQLIAQKEEYRETAAALCAAHHEAQEYKLRPRIGTAEDVLQRIDIARHHQEISEHALSRIEAAILSAKEVEELLVQLEEAIDLESANEWDFLSDGYITAVAGIIPNWATRRLVMLQPIVARIEARMNVIAQSKLPSAKVELRVLRKRLKGIADQRDALEADLQLAQRAAAAAATADGINGDLRKDIANWSVRNGFYSI